MIGEGEATLNFTIFDKHLACDIRNVKPIVRDLENTFLVDQSTNGVRISLGQVMQEDW